MRTFYAYHLAIVMTLVVRPLKFRQARRFGKDPGELGIAFFEYCSRFPRTSSALINSCRQHWRRYRK